MAENDDFNFVAKEIDEGPSEDYFWRSVITLALYWLTAFIGGVIANVIFLVQSKRDMDAGIRVDGRGCLWALLIVHVVLVLISLVVLIVMVLAGPVIGDVYGDVIACTAGSLI